MLYKLKRAIRNLRDWLPIILKDNHWDYRYLYDILYRKLELKEDFFRSDKSHISDWEQVANEIKEVKDALRRLMDDEYVSVEEVMKDARASVKKEEELKKIDMDIVFDGMKRNIEKWWD